METSAIKDQYEKLNFLPISNINWSYQMGSNTFMLNFAPKAETKWNKIEWLGEIISCSIYYITSCYILPLTIVE
jgi:hypothetical protein